MNSNNYRVGQRPPVHCIGIHDKSPEMRLLYISSSVRQAMQYEPSDIIGQSSLPFVVSDNADDYKRLIEAQNLNNVVMTGIYAWSPTGDMHFMRVIHFNCDNIALNFCTIFPDPLPEAAEARPMSIEFFDPSALQAQGPGSGTLEQLSQQQHSEVTRVANSIGTAPQNRPNNVMRYARTCTKACLILEGSLSTNSENNPSGPAVLFASNSFSRILDVDVSDLQGLPFLSLVAAQDALAAARFLEKMSAPEEIVLEKLRFMADPVDSGADGLQSRLVTVEVLGTGSDEGAIILCQLDDRHSVRSRYVEDDELDGYMSLEEIITSDPETSDISDVWKTAHV
ncbi:hypothetical protein IWW50_000394 [Coemansia erecta]|nr:hypothetical protein GGF43_000598 [Coemansia sp. RSA 2618]KAJ2830251.1 hypothetical protein IWW50_000394 [Coemansia erecta]